ncbi:MAG: hypothetical protein ACRDI2_18575, partial [Chloroflexota bacterium]
HGRPTWPAGRGDTFTQMALSGQNCATVGVTPQLPAPQAIGRAAGRGSRRGMRWSSGDEPGA